MTALRSLGVAPEAWTRATRVDEARGSSRARERVVKKAFRRLALRAHPDKRRGCERGRGRVRGGGGGVRDGARGDDDDETTRDASSRRRANVCDGVTNRIVRHRSRARDDDRDVADGSGRRAAATRLRRSTAVRDDDGDDDDSNAKPSNEESFGRARCAL